jgi:serine/threonine protein kinase
MLPDRLNLSPEEWTRVEALFERLLEARDPQALLTAESDSSIAAAAALLLDHHLKAGLEGFLDEPITLIRDLTSAFAPRFAAGQILASRFMVERLLGSGGMGEVYLALDQRLNERVALKTIRNHIAGDPAIRRRFIAEIQNARRVTHPNICRIFDLYDEGDATFFSMVYLEGIQLPEFLREPGPTAEARRIALELAEGLAAAHRSQVLHCDFKPGNVILTGVGRDARAVITDFGLARALYGCEKEHYGEPNREGADWHSNLAGTREYMAPELFTGSLPSIKTDIYAYGKVLAALIPESRMARKCTSVDPVHRPNTLEPVIRDLRGNSTRRAWLIGGAGASVAAVATYKIGSRPRLVLVGRQRVLVNAFRPNTLSPAGLARDLLVTALRQSATLIVVGDDHLRSLLRAMQFPTTLPAERRPLLIAAERERAALVLEGTLEPIGQGIRVLLQIFVPVDVKPALEISEQVNDSREIISLVDRIAHRLRREFGESEAALHASYTPLQQITSALPEAVEFYFRGVREYDSAGARNAEAWFDQALRLDPQFALAHLYRGISLAARFQVLEAIPSYERAFALRGRLSERESLLIESRYYNVIGDYVSSLNASRRLVLLFPEEAAFQRTAAFTSARLGRPRDALPFNKRAVELDPSDINLSELLVNHTDANLCDDALALYNRFRDEGHTSTLLDWGAGMAYMGKGDNDSALAAFDRMAISPERERWSKLLRCGPLILQGRFAEAAAALSSDLAFDVATGEQSRRATRRVWLGFLDWMMDSSGPARSQAKELADLEASPAWIQQLREGAMLALAVRDGDSSELALRKLTQIEKQWPSTHSSGARRHIQGAIMANNDNEAATELLSEACGLWPDPLTLFSDAEWHFRRHECEQCVVVLDKIEEQRGRLLRLYFPGLLVLSRLMRARCLVVMSRFAEAQRIYEQILNLWRQHAGSFPLVRQIGTEYLSLQRHSIKGDKHDRFLGSIRQTSY